MRTFMELYIKVMHGAFALKLTEKPRDAAPGDLEPLRDHGLSDEDILVLVHVIGYFNHINRVALGVDLEPDMTVSPY